MIEIATVSSPIGDLLLATKDGALVALEPADRRDRFERHLGRRYAGEPRRDVSAPPSALENALAAYFAGEKDALAGFVVAPIGTPFQERVWRDLLAIPAGTTTTYGALAKKLGSAPRAVGAAVGANPIALVVPCHRVIGESGSLTGYAGGLDRKRWLLAHEASTRSRACLFESAATRST